jgi:hypothetical protein
VTTSTLQWSDLFLAEGVLHEVQHSRTKVNLLALVEKNVATKSLSSGVAAAVSGMPGIMANSAMVALYDGEDMYNFAALLGDKVLCGTFESGNAFDDGDRVKAVVSKQGDALLAHAVMRDDDKMLFMPAGCHAGHRALLRQCMKHAWNMCRWGWVVLGLFWLFFFGKYSTSEASTQELVLIATSSVVGPMLLTFGMEYWTFRSLRSSGEQASAILRVLGFPEPSELNLLPYLTTTRAPDNEYRNLSAFNYERALSDHAKRFA